MRMYCTKAYKSKRISGFFGALFCFCIVSVGGFSLAGFENIPSDSLVAENSDHMLSLETRILVITGADHRSHRFTVEIADTPEARARGLMFRRSLGPQAGMLFIYPEPRLISIWMKNTYLSLDILYIDENGDIVQIIENAVPLSETSMPSKQPVHSVLELNAGSVARLGLKLGDSLFLSGKDAADSR